MRIDAVDIKGGYGRTDVLHDVSLHLDGGEFVGLVGPNGSGKTTLLRALTGLLKLRRGEVRLDGKALGELDRAEIARRLAFVPQNEPRLFEFSVRDVVLMGRHARRSRSAAVTEEDHAIVTRALASADLLDVAERPITEMSGGEHRRTLFARALAQDSPALLVDEPTAHLDVAHQWDTLRICRRLADLQGVAVLAALHDLNLAAEFCDRLVLLHHGRIIADGPPSTVLTDEFLGRVYGPGIRVMRNPATGAPLLTPSSRCCGDEAQAVKPPARRESDRSPCPDGACR